MKVTADRVVILKKSVDGTLFLAFDFQMKMFWTPNIIDAWEFEKAKQAEGYIKSFNDKRFNFAEIKEVKITFEMED